VALFLKSVFSFWSWPLFWYVVSWLLIDEIIMGSLGAASAVDMTKMVVFGNFWLFLMMIVQSKNICSKASAELFSQCWLFESYWPPKRELKKTCLRQKMGCSTRICYFVLHFLFWGPILVCRSKKMADYITWCCFFGFFGATACWMTKMMGFFGYFLISTSSVSATWDSCRC